MTDTKQLRSIICLSFISIRDTQPLSAQGLHVVLFETMRIALQKWAKPRPWFRGNFEIFQKHSKYPQDLKVVALLPLAPTPAPSHKIQNEGHISPTIWGEPQRKLVG